MAILLREHNLKVKAEEGRPGLLSRLEKACSSFVSRGSLPVRIAVTSTTPSHYDCELGAIDGLPPSTIERLDSIFECRHRPADNAQQFNIVLVVPTGIGAEIGG